MLLRLPDELLMEVVVNLDLPDILSCSATCKALRAFVTKNEALWRAVMRKTFDSPSSTAVAPAHRDTTADQRLLTTGQEDQLVLLMNIRSSARAPPPPSSSPAATSSSSRKYSAFEEYKRRIRLFLKNNVKSRTKYASPQYRLRMREMIVTTALQLLREHEHYNYSILAQSQLFSAVIFDQLVPGTIPALQLERLPPATAYTLKPSAYVLQQQIDMLRLVFGQRIPCSPLAYSLQELQAICYDSSHFPLFTTPDATASNRAGAGPIDRRVNRLPDSAWADLEALSNTSILPRFDVILAILNFFAYHSDRVAVVRDGLLPFFNTPPDAGDFNFKETGSFQFPRDWTGLYGYLAFWDFDLLRRAASSPVDQQATAGTTTASTSDDQASTSRAVPTGSSARAQTGPVGSSGLANTQSESSVNEEVRPGLSLPPDPYHHPSTMPSASLSVTNANVQESSSTTSGLPVSSSSSPHASPALPSNTGAPQGTNASTNANVKTQDQFDGFQIMETDVPPIQGPVSFMGRGRDRFDYVMYATLSPLEPCFGLPGFARFGMRKEYVKSEYSADDEDEVVWEYNGVYIPGPKILLGRWRDGTDISQTNAVEGPFMFFADEL